MPKSFQSSLVLKGILLAAVLALILSLVLSILLFLTKLPESDLALNLILIASILVASAIVANQTGTKGLYYGLAIGLGFTFLLLFVSAVFSASPPSWLHVGEKTIFNLFAGGVGGVIGVIFKR